ncbi:MAG: hypothetical protein HY866_00540 [Chloroflexi bacterium]|nr:hypothetical protein [Chloroflexota bacterium]
MDSAPEFLNLFVESTGELIYFLAVIAISQAALLMALGQRMRGASEIAAGRYATLLAGVVLAWLAMGLGGVVALVTETPDDAILPPIERAVNMLVILFAGAALLAADNERPDRRLRRIMIGVGIAVIAAYLYTAVTWHPLADDQEFNHHSLAFAWTFAAGLLIICQIALLLSRYKDTADIPLKMIFFAVLLLGYSYTSAKISSDTLDGDTSGALRLAFLTAMPTLAIIVYRLVIDRLNAAIDEVSEYAEAVSRPQAAVKSAAEPFAAALPPAPPPQPYVSRSSAGHSSTSESMSLLKAIGMMLEKEEPDQIPRQVAIAIATVLRADLAVVVSPDESGWADVLAAYDHIQQRLIPGLALNLSEQPSLRQALETKSSKRLQVGANLDELIDLYARLDINQVGPAHLQPLTRSGQMVGMVIVGLPYTNRSLSDSEITLLEGLAPVAARLITVSRAAQRLRSDVEAQVIQAVVQSPAPEATDQQSMQAIRQEMQASLALAQEQISDLNRTVRDLQLELDYERSRLAQLKTDGDETLSITQRIEVLSQERSQLATEREQLTRALQEAQATLVSAQGDEDIFTTMSEVLRHERDDLQAQKARLERQLREIREGQDTGPAGALREMLSELSEDKAKLSAERDAMLQELENVQAELRALGIEEGPLALAKALSELTEQRSYFKARAEKIAKERDLLLGERKKIEGQIQREAEREAQIAALENDLRRLAEDREALTKQRDSIRAERDDLLKGRETWFDQRTRLIAEATVVQNDLDDTLFKLNKINTDRARLSEQRSALEAERNHLLAETTALKTERDQLMARAEGNRELLEKLGVDGVGSFKAIIDDLAEQKRTLESQLLQAQRDFDLLEQQHSRPPGSSTQMTQPIAPANAEVIMSISQELRTPMSSIMGYTDLLLGESVGILGALQRQFLQRVQANIDRLSKLINDLVSITRLDSKEFELQPITMDMLEVIEDAITSAGNQFREKSITLHMNLDDHLPPLRVDRDAMYQVIMQLLSNAYLASPANGEIAIAARFARHFVPPQTDPILPPYEPADVILVSVTDQGGGVPPDEQRRVFGRLYRADNPLIEGIGDTGVGLSIAKALVEAHEGTIWLESKPGQGSTFHFILPLSSQPAFIEER